MVFAITMFAPASIPLQQRHQKHLKIAPEARAPCQLSCCPLPAPPLCCCSMEAHSSPSSGAPGMGTSGQPHTSSRSQGMAAAFLPGSSPSTKGHRGVSVPAPLHLVSAKGRWSDICDNRLSPAGGGHRAVPALGNSCR